MLNNHLRSLAYPEFRGHASIIVKAVVIRFFAETSYETGNFMIFHMVYLIILLKFIFLLADC